MKLNSMTLDEQVLACARANGYDGKGTRVTRPQYPEPADASGGDMGEWWIENNITVRRGEWWIENNITVRRVTDEDFKQWQRDYKLKQILK